MKLFAWQERAIRDSRDHDGWGLFARPGTGKTLAALTIAQDAGLRPVVVCPKAVKREWHAVGVQHVYHYEQLRSASHRAAIAAAMTAAPSCLILDESHRIANPATQTNKAAMKLAPLARKRLCLTGTPTANSPADLWSQLRFLRPTARLESRREWQERYIECLPSTHPLMRQLRGNPFIPRKHRDGTLMVKNLDDLSRRVAAYGTSVDDAEMADLPERTFMVRHCLAAEELMTAYGELRQQCITEIAGNTITAENAAVLATRLLRLASGLGASDMALPLQNPKLVQLLDDLPALTSEGRVIIWSVWQRERADLCAALRDSGAQWTDDVQVFLSDDTIPVLVGSPKQIGAGLNLQVATYQLWLSRTWSLIEREQALHRNYRVGQTRRTTVIDYITDGTIDEAVMRALDAKHNLLTYVMRGIVE